MIHSFFSGGTEVGGGCAMNIVSTTQHILWKIRPRDLRLGTQTHSSVLVWIQSTFAPCASHLCHLLWSDSFRHQTKTNGWSFASSSVQARLSCGLSKHWGRSRQMMNIFKALDMVAVSAPVCWILATYLRTVLVTRSLLTATASAI